MGTGPHGSPGDAKHRPETATQPSLRRPRKLACDAPPHHEDLMT
jgi:hypothetical protein